MDKRSEHLLAAWIFTFTLAFAGCQEKEEPIPSGTSASVAPTSGAYTGAGSVTASAIVAGVIFVGAKTLFLLARRSLQFKGARGL